MRRGIGYWRRLVLITACGMLPAFFLRCDKASLNFQRAFWQGLGEDAADIVVEQTAGLSERVD